MPSCTIKETTTREQSRIITVLTYIMYNVQDIVFGSTIHLLCTLDGSLGLNNGRSRQWFGDSENKVLSFDGFSSDPNKYEEHVISTR
jgi:hypothetical protein